LAEYVEGFVEKDIAKGQAIGEPLSYRAGIIKVWR
jgi:hypothetical protein